MKLNSKNLSLETRKRFSDLFSDLLKTQLVLKGVVSLEEWDDMKEHIQYDFVADNYFSELKEKELLNERMALLAQMDPFAGKYFSLEYLRRQILRQTDSEFTEIDKQMKKEIKDGKVLLILCLCLLWSMSRWQCHFNLRKKRKKEWIPQTMKREISK